MKSGMMVTRAADPLALLALPRRWYQAARRLGQSPEEREARALQLGMDRLRYHLGRGRRAKDAGHFEEGVSEARKALLINPQSGWALALLGQCLTRQRQPELRRARQALERAQALDPTNGYFVRLLLDVLDAEGDLQARADVLAWAWWHGAPVDRWLPDGPPVRRADPAADTRESTAPRRSAMPASGTVSSAARSRGRARESVLTGR